MDLVLDLLGIGTLVLLAVVFVPLELLVPMHRQRLLRSTLRHDLVYWFVNRLVIQFGLTVAVVVALATVRPLVPGAVVDSVGRLSLWLQVPLAVLIMDLGFYSVHRLFHRVPFLWQFHAVHHSVEELDWLAGIRVHPLDQILTKSASVLPLVLLGFSEATVSITALIYLWQSHFVHANLRAELGPFRWLVAGPGFHHWHHSSDPEAWNSNFAGQLPFLDRLFGTAYFPADRLPTAYGSGEPVPPGYVDQVFWPFRRLIGATAAREIVPTDPPSPDRIPGP